MAGEIRIPRLGWSMEEGTFLGWKKRAGEPVQVGEVLYELEGEKATQEIESLDSGILHIAPSAPAAGAVVPVGTLLGCVAPPGASVDWQALAPSDAAHSDTTIAPPAQHASPAAAPSVRRLARELGISLDEVHARGLSRRVTRLDVEVHTQQEIVAVPAQANQLTKASPRARRAARQRGIDWETLAGTGRNGRVRERDVLASSSPLLAEHEDSIAVTRRRRTIAERMVHSLERTAPVTLTSRADVTELVRLRSGWKDSGSAVVPTYSDLVAWLSAAVLERHLPLAGRWEQDRIVVPKPGHIHIGIAVDTPEGLLVPVVRHVSSLSIEELARQASDLAERARAGKLTAEEMQGASFTLTNLGGFGIDAFTPIIDWPQTAILGLGAIRREPVYVTQDRVEPRERMTLSLTFDHRALDGAPAARFLAELREAIEQAAEQLTIR